MKTIDELKDTLREVDQSKYPELRCYTKDSIWRDSGPGGLYLVSLLAAELELEPGLLVLDLGWPIISVTCRNRPVRLLELAWSGRLTSTRRVFSVRVSSAQFRVVDRGSHL